MDLSDARNEIDRIDDSIVDLMKKRIEVTAQIARYKSEHDQSILDKGRERAILSRMADKAGEGYEMYARALFTTLFGIGKSYQSRAMGCRGELSSRIHDALENTPRIFPNKAVVACQGTEGSYSQAATDKLFSLPNIVYFNTFEAVFQAVEQGLCDYGMLPIENSSYGSVTEVYDLMKQRDFHIARSVKLHIHHALLANVGVKLDDIKEIYSHEQAIGQCGEFLRELSDVHVNVVENTAVAARMVKESGRSDVAAISAVDCARLYDLNVLSESIQNSDNNYTRFICISKKLEIYPGANKISLMFTVPHEPGSLYSMISKFATLGVNLTKLESRPLAGSDFEFMFYFDMDASVYDAAFITLLCELDETIDQFVFLGAYSEV